MITLPLLAVLAAVFLAKLLVERLWPSQKIIPQPRLSRVPFFGNAAQALSDPLSAVERAGNHSGNVFKFNMGILDHVWLRGDDLNKFYVETKEDVWSFGGGMVRFTLLHYSFSGKLTVRNRVFF